MKTTIQDLKKETFRLLNNYLGLNFEDVVREPAGRTDGLLTQTPDFFNSRMSGVTRTHANPNRHP